MKKIMLGLTALVAIIGTSVMTAPSANAQGYFYVNNLNNNWRAREIRHERVMEHRAFERRQAERRFENSCGSRQCRRFGW